MTRDVAAARAAVEQAALARDEAALRAIADSLPPLTAFGYERHRARAFANAIRGAHDSAVAELCLGVAACPPTASTFVADSAQLRLLGDVREARPVDPAFRRHAAWAGPRLAASGVALAAAVAALVVLPGHVFEDTTPEAAGITAPARSAPPRVVVAEQSPGSTASPSESRAGDRAPGGADGSTLVSADPVLAGTSSSTTSPGSTDLPEPRAAVSQRRPRPLPAPTRPPAAAPAPAPAPPSEAPSAPGAEAPTPAPATATTASAPAAPEREPKGKARGKAQAPGQLKGETGRPDEPPAAAPPAPAAPSGDPPSPQGPPDPHPGRGHGRDGDRGP